MRHNRYRFGPMRRRFRCVTHAFMAGNSLILCFLLVATLLSGCSKIAIGDLRAMFGAEAQPPVPPQPQPKPAAGEIVVSLEPTEITRHRMPRVSFDKSGNTKIERMADEKMARGMTDIDGEKIVFYLPARGPYFLSSDPDAFDNQSVEISIDGNNDGKLSRSESWWASNPLRLGNRMFDVKQVDAGGTWVLLAKSSSPLSGLVIGKPCPPFALTMADGKTTTLADYKGKTLLLDVWSFT